MEKNNFIIDRKLPWVEKYRPENLKDIVGHSKIIDILDNFAKSENFPHLLIYGPPGTGKTSCIHAISKKLYGKYHKIMALELNASDERGIETVRKRIKQFVSFSNPILDFSKNRKTFNFKLVILDETDAITPDSQAILRKIIEKYSFNARFCLICNHIRKITLALKSRCTLLNFRPIPNDQIEIIMKKIINSEGISIMPDAMELIMDKSDGDMRKMINTLQSCNSINKSFDNSLDNSQNNPITVEDIYDVILIPKRNDIVKFITKINTHNIFELYKWVKKYIDLGGFSMNEIINELYIIIFEDIGINNYYSDENIIQIIIELGNFQYSISTLEILSVQIGKLITILKK